MRRYSKQRKRYCHDLEWTIPAVHNRVGNLLCFLQCLALFWDDFDFLEFLDHFIKAQVRQAGSPCRCVFPFNLEKLSLLPSSECLRFRSNVELQSCTVTCPDWLTTRDRGATIKRDGISLDICDTELAMENVWISVDFRSSCCDETDLLLGCAARANRFF